MVSHINIIRTSISISQNKYNKANELLNKYIGTGGENKLQLADDIYNALLINRVRVAIKEQTELNAWVSIYASNSGKSIIRQARLLRFKGQQAAFNNDINEINASFASALELYREMANPKAVLSTLKEWGEALQNNSQNLQAAKQYESAYRVAASASLEKEMTGILTNLLSIYQLQGDTKNSNRIHKLLQNI